MPKVLIDTNNVSREEVEELNEYLEENSWDTWSLKGGSTYQGGGEIGLYKIREDLIEDGLSIQIGSDFYDSPSDRFKGKWVDEEFSVWYKGEWIDGEDIHIDLEPTGQTMRSTYQGGGEITNEDYERVVRNWVYFTYNYPNGFVKSAFANMGSLTDHMVDKWKSAYAKVGNKGAVNEFYAQLSRGNRQKLTDWVRENYFNNTSQKESLLAISSNDYYRIVNHWFFFGMSYPHGFIKGAFPSNTEHFDSKWKTAYDKAGSMGAINSLYTELSGTYQDDLAKWAKDNYSGSKLKNGGSTSYAEGGEIKSSTWFTKESGLSFLNW